MKSLLYVILNIYSYIILIRCVLSFVGNVPDNKIFQFINDITEPVLKQCRKVLPPQNGIDFSPMIVFVAIFLLERLLTF